MKQTSKEQTELPRFILEGPRPCISSLVAAAVQTLRLVAAICRIVRFGLKGHSFASVQTHVNVDLQL